MAVSQNDQEKRRSWSLTGAEPVMPHSPELRRASEPFRSDNRLPLDSRCSKNKDCQTDLCEYGMCACMENTASPCRLNENCCSGICDASSRCISEEFHQKQRRATAILDEKMDFNRIKAPPLLRNSPKGIRWTQTYGKTLPKNSACWGNIGGIPCEDGLFCMKWTSKLASPGMCHFTNHPQPEHSLCHRDSQCLSDRCRLFTCTCIPEGGVCSMNTVCCSNNCHAGFCISGEYSRILTKQSQQKYNQGRHIGENEDGLFLNPAAEAETKAKAKMKTVRAQSLSNKRNPAFLSLEKLDASGLTVSDKQKFMTYHLERKSSETMAEQNEPPRRRRAVSVFRRSLNLRPQKLATLDEET